MIQAIIKKITTSIDGGYILSFDIAEDQKEEIKSLFDLLNQVVNVTIEKSEKQNLS